MPRPGRRNIGGTTHLGADRDGLGPVASAELAQDVRHVVFHGAGAQEEAGADVGDVYRGGYGGWLAAALTTGFSAAGTVMGG